MVIIVYYTDAPHLTMGLHLGEPTVSRKCRKLKIHLIVHCKYRCLPSCCLAEWELWFPATVQHHKRLSYQTLLAQKKSKNSKFKV